MSQLLSVTAGTRAATQCLGHWTIYDIELWPWLVSYLQVSMCRCGYLLCSVSDVLGELVQTIFDMVSVRVGLSGQRQGTHALLPLFTRWGALWWTQPVSVAPQGGAGSRQNAATHLQHTRFEKDVSAASRRSRTSTHTEQLLTSLATGARSGPEARFWFSPSSSRLLAGCTFLSFSISSLMSADSSTVPSLALTL